MILETNRLVLKSPHPKLAGKVLDFYKNNSDFLNKWEPERCEEFYTLKYHYFDLKEQLKRFHSDNEYRFWIMKKDTAYLIGSVSLSCIIRGNFNSCFMSYKIDKKEANKGYITEAGERVLNFGFKTAKLHRVEINVGKENNASVRVAEKLGFLKEGLSPKYLKINGKWMDHLRYAKLNGED